MIKVLLFAELQERIGKASLEMDNEIQTVAELKKKLQEEYELHQLDQVMTAINEEYATNEDTIKSGDVIAFIPPVSGG